MIFVTVGSVAPFDRLIMKVDELVGNGAINDVVAQIGNGAYVPQNAKWFRFEPDLSKYYAEADLIITHNGAGTLFEILAMGKKAIAIPNPGTIQMENLDIVRKLSNDGNIMLCMDVDDLEEALEQSKSWIPAPYEEPRCRIHEVIEEFLSRLAKK